MSGNDYHPERRRDKFRSERCNSSNSVSSDESECESREEVKLPSPLPKHAVKTPENTVVGPALPPEMKNTAFSESDVMGPALPPKEECNPSIMGPALPPGIQNPSTSKNDLIGPALPPKLENNFAIIGPTLPLETMDSESKVIGPILPPHLRKVEEVNEGELSSESEEEIFGPDPSVMSLSYTSNLEDIERRAKKMKKNLAGEIDDGSLQRESWMLELPPERAAEFGMGPRQFKKKHQPENLDRSGWTETPGNEIKKTVNYSDLLKQKSIQERDKEMEKMMKKAKKKAKREKSLLEMHQEKIKKKAKKEAKKREKEGKKEERRPFDRNVDLQANRFDEAQKRSIIKKAQGLDSRFSQGASKFL